MNYDKFFTFAQVGIFVLIALTFLVVGVRRFTSPPPQPSYYSLSKERLRENLSPWRLSRFVSPPDLQIQRVDDKSTNVWGWLECTNNAGLVKTQWFRCLFFKPALRQHYVKDSQFFKSDPGLPTPALP